MPKAPAIVSSSSPQVLQTVSRAQALKLGLNRYFTGKPCVRGHIAPRTVSSYKCVKCNVIKVHQWRREDNGRAKTAIYNRRWRLKNLERFRRVAKKWVANNPDAMRAKKARRRALEYNAKGKYTAQDVQQIKKKQRNRCAAPHCKIKLKNYHVDHVVPLYRGGSNWPTNIQLLCAICNDSKGARTMQEWLEDRRG